MKHFFSFEEAIELLRVGVCGFTFRNGAGQYFSVNHNPADGSAVVTEIAKPGDAA